MVRGRGRGRGGRAPVAAQGRGRGRGNQNQPLNVAVIAGEENDSGPDDIMGQVDEFDAPPLAIEDDFHVEAIDDEDADVFLNNLPNLGIGENLANLPVGPAVAPANVPSHQVIAALGNNQDRINGRDFVPGDVENEKTLEYYRNFSPTQIVLDLGQPYLNTLRDCSNGAINVTMFMKDLYCYHAILTRLLYTSLTTCTVQEILR